MQPQNDQPESNNQMAQPQVVRPSGEASNVVVSTPLFAPDNPSPSAAADGKSNAPKGHFLRNASLAVLGLVILGGLVAGGFVMTGGLTSYNRQHATSTAVKFIGFLNENQDSKAYQASSSNLRNAQTETQFSQNLGDLTAKNPKFSDQNIQVKGDKAVYTATVDGLPATASGRTDGIFTIALVKHGVASWQVDSVQVE